MPENSRFFRVEIITPQGIFYGGAAVMIEFETTAGKLGVYKNHIPLTVILAPGEVRLHEEMGDGELALIVSEGFAEILPDQVTIIADSAKRLGH